MANLFTLTLLNMLQYFEKFHHLSQEHKFVVMKSKILSPFKKDHVGSDIIKFLIITPINAIKLSTHLHTGNMRREFY